MAASGQSKDETVQFTVMALDRTGAVSLARLLNPSPPHLLILIDWRSFWNASESSAAPVQTALACGTIYWQFPRYVLVNCWSPPPPLPSAKWLSLL